MAATDFHRPRLQPPPYYQGPFVYDHLSTFPDTRSPASDQPRWPGRAASPASLAGYASRPWSRSQDQSVSAGRSLTSERVRDSALSVASGGRNSDASLPSLPPVRDSGRQEQQQQQKAHSSSASSPPASAASASRWQLGSGRTLELPPLPQAPSVSGGSFSPVSRSAVIPPISNPVEPANPLSTRRRKASELESLSTSLPILPPMAVRSHYGSSASSYASSAATVASSPSEGSPRRILTPRSPSRYPAVTLNQINPPAATMSVQQNPFAVSPRVRAPTLEPGTSRAPSMPMPIAVARQVQSSSAPSPPAQHSQRAHVEVTFRAARPASESTSPRSSAQASPASYSANALMPNLSASYSESNDSSVGTPVAPGAPDYGDRQPVMGGVPITSSTGHSVFQMMALDTGSGTYPVTVDLQAASKVADEKRKRNAGASARFRLRRKEKERESCTTISRLEQQVKELSEDMDFYKRERDYLGGVVLQVPGGDRHFPRPPSPRHRRASSLASVGASSSSGYMSLQEHGPSGMDDGRNVRRRTSTRSLPSHSQTQAATPVSSHQASYTPQEFAQHSAHQPGPLPSPISRHVLPGPPQHMQLTATSAPWQSYSEHRQ